MSGWVGGWVSKALLTWSSRRAIVDCKGSAPLMMPPVTSEWIVVLYAAAMATAVGGWRYG